MADRVTIQDIADALGLSRNTVSKAINNTGVLADATRQKVLAKAIEMGYKQFSYVNARTLDQGPRREREKTEIALLSTWFLNSSHFSSMMLDKFQLEISEAGFSMSMHVVRDEEIREKALPASLHMDHLAGIICFELFDEDYAQMLSTMDIPVLFVDEPVSPGCGPLPADLLLMDNSSAISTFIADRKNEGVRSIGFIGEYLHCRSFYERYMAFRNAMYLNGLPLKEDWILAGNVKGVEHPDSSQYRTYLSERLSSMKKCPEIFICANDFVAIDAMAVLDTLGIRVPEDVKILGFDDSAEASLVSPKLSSIHIHSQIMGYSAAQLLISRIDNPDLNFRTVYCETNLVLRGSTGN